MQWTLKSSSIGLNRYPTIKHTSLCEGCAKGVWKKRSGNDAWKPNLRSREVEAPFARGASIPRMGISMAAILENFLVTGVLRSSYFLLGVDMGGQFCYNVGVKI